MAAAAILSAGICLIAVPAAACAPPADALFDVSRLPAFAEPRAHPLIGRVVDLRSPAGQPLPCPVSGVEQLLRVLGAADIDPGKPVRARLLVLGEVHDNPAHHALRAALVEVLSVSRGDRAPFAAKPALVFEHIRADQQPDLDRFAEFDRTARRLGTTGDLLRMLDWDKSGWPDKAMFEPLFAAALRARLPIVPGDPPRETVRRVAREGLAALDAAEIARLGLSRPFDEGLQDALLTDLEASHCGLMPKSRFTKLAEAQRYRDAFQAAALVVAGQQHGAAILFAGNGHARTDRGVPYYVRQLAPAANIVSIQLVEVEDGRTETDYYVPRGSGGMPAVDFIILTPRAPRADPCEEMKKAFAKPK